MKKTALVPNLTVTRAIIPILMVLTVISIASAAPLYNVIDLGSFGSYVSSATSINNMGQIIGAINIDPVLFDSTGAGNNIDLGALGGGTSEAYSINNNGQIVGWALDILGSYCATLFDSTGNGKNINLNTFIDPTLGWTLRYAYDINDNGWIVGAGRNPQGYERAFLLTPVPEPATMLLLGIGFVIARKRR